MSDSAAWPRLDPLLARLLPPSSSRLVVLSGPGGSGLTEAMGVLAEGLVAAGVRVTRGRGRRLERDQPYAAVADLIGTTTVDLDPRGARTALVERVGAGGALLIDDAQWLDEPSLEVVAGLTDRLDENDQRLVLGHRPVPSPPGLAALDALADAAAGLTDWGPLDHDELSRRTAAALGAPPQPSCLEVLAEQSGGVLYLVDQLLRGWQAAGVLDRGAFRGDPPDPLLPPDPVRTAVRTRLAVLPDDARAVVATLAVAGALDPRPLAEAAQLELAALGPAIAAARAEGLLTPGADRLPVVVAAAIADLLPASEVQDRSARVAAALAAAGATPAEVAAGYLRSGMRTEAAAAAMVDAGHEALVADPSGADRWFEEAARAGGSGAEVLAGRARAAAYQGRHADALGFAERALAEAEAEGGAASAGATARATALAVIAGTLAGRGLHDRAAGRYAVAADAARSAGDEVTATVHDLAGAFEAAVAGQRDEAVVVLQRSGWGSGARADEALASSVAASLVQGLLATLLGGPMAGAATVAPVDDALALLSEAVDLAELAGLPPLLPDTPHAVAALVALAALDLPRASQFLERALQHGVGGAAHEARHLLLRGWVDLRSGRLPQAEAALAAVADLPRTPRDDLLAAAIEAGVVRRSGDVGSLSDVWARVKPVLLAARPDLLTLGPLGEMAALATRIGVADVARPQVDASARLLEGLGQPALWALPLWWDGMQAASVAGDSALAGELATLLRGAVPVSPAQGVLVDAAAVWVDLLAGVVQAEPVDAAADRLQSLNLGWEATHLTGQAAIRSTEASVTRALLGRARDLKGAVGVAPDRMSADSALSERELEVATLVVDGLTHKEVGERLFISPKTVEHHVARIRQKLGATTRAEMLASLQSILRRG